MREERPYLSAQRHDSSAISPVTRAKRNSGNIACAYTCRSAHGAFAANRCNSAAPMLHPLASEDLDTNFVSACLCVGGGWGEEGRKEREREREREGEREKEKHADRQPNRQADSQMNGQTGTHTDTYTHR